MPPDWRQWHRAYDHADSPLSRRLVVVQRMVREVLDAAPEGRIRVLSLCCGDARDLLGVLEAHPRRHDVSGALVELDEGLASAAARAVANLGLHDVRVVQADAARPANYARWTPADLVLVCGVFGNISESDIRAVIAEMPRLTADGASVVWTRHRGAPDLVPAIRAWWGDAGFAEAEFVAVPDSLASVGRASLATAEGGACTVERLFEFVGDGDGAHA